MIWQNKKKDICKKSNKNKEKNPIKLEKIQEKKKPSNTKI